MTCKVCKEDSNFITTHNLLGLIESNIYQCKSCKTLFRDPIPSEHQLFDYYSKRDGRYDEILEQKMANFQSNWLDSNFVKNGFDKSRFKYVELGCGRGWLVSNMEKLGYVSLGFDPDFHSVNWGKANLGVNISQGFLDIENNNLELDNNGNLIISMMHVLEHLSKPAEVFNYFSNNLKNHLLFFEVPDGEFEADVLKLDTLNCNSSGQHFFSFTEKGLIALLENSGYEVVILEKFGNKNFWNSYLRAMKVWGLIDRKYKYLRDKKFTFYDIFVLGILLSFKTIFYWTISKFEDVFFNKTSRLNLPVIRVLAKRKQ